jgi:acyl carrier protein
LSENDILSRLVSILQDTLRVDHARITPEARLFDDLGAESLDLLDIRFRVDEAFSIRTSAEELIRSLGSDLSAEEIQAKLTVHTLVLYISVCLQKETV